MPMNGRSSIQPCIHPYKDIKINYDYYELNSAAAQEPLKIARTYIQRCHVRNIYSRFHKFRKALTTITMILKQTHARTHARMHPESWNPVTKKARECTDAYHLTLSYLKQLCTLRSTLSKRKEKQIRKSIVV